MVPTLSLRGGSFVAGQFQEVDQPGRIRWQGRGFSTPFEFDLQAIDSVVVPAAAPGQPPRPEGDFRFELAGGDLAFGTLRKLDEKVAELEFPGIGLVRLPRTQLLRIERWSDRSDLIFLGPNGLAGWTLSPAGDPNAWRVEGGALQTEQAGAALFQDLGLPASVAFDLELSWKAKPDFVLALGVGDDEKSVASAFRFEVWGDDLVVQRETPNEADLASVARLEAGAGRVHLKLFLDQKLGRIVVETPEGKTLADLKVTEENPRVLPGLRLENKRGDVRLERLEVTQWSGELLREARPDGPSLRQRDGSSRSAKGIRYDADARTFVVPDGEKEQVIPRDQVDRVTLLPLTDAPARPVHVMLQNGTRISGELLRVERGAVVMSLPEVAEPIRLPLGRLRSLIVHHDEKTPAAEPAPLPRLEMEGVRLSGQLVAAPAASGEGASCLAWQASGAVDAKASPLTTEASGRVVYKEPPPTIQVGGTRVAGNVQVFRGAGNAAGMIAVAQPLPINARVGAVAVAPAAPPRPGGLAGFVMGFAGVNSRPSTAPTAGGAATAERRSLYLRTGDMIPADVVKIDEKGVTVRTDISESAFVPHEKIKAVEFGPEPIVPVLLNKAKRERLLTLPRMQKGSPPTHLIRSKNGDYLRGRVIELDDKVLKVELRLEVKTIPRDRVARILWLHADEAEAAKGKGEAKEPDAAEASAGPFEVQAVRKNGVRLTFAPERLEQGVLQGKSSVLGVCRVSLDDLDQLLIGKVIETEAAQLTFQRWLLTDAPEPKVTDEAGDGASPGGGGGASGLSSPLVGKPAPDFSLEQLGGKTFRLTEAKGKVVLLDFWATWCGPCLQAMPQVEKVAEEFRNQGVILIAVNLQESPKEITAMLERHKLNPTVALDKDGRVAEKYQASAIPQTVIIDREGNVARLFVGGGPRLGDQLRDALKATLNGNGTDTAPKPVPADATSNASGKDVGP